MTAEAVEPIVEGIGSVIALLEVKQSSIVSMLEEQSAGKLVGFIKGKSIGWAWQSTRESIEPALAGT